MADVDTPAVRRSGCSAFPGFSLRVVARTRSTQDLVRAAARTGAGAGFCCVAGEQTAGRGRQGRSWTAPANTALLMSILLQPGARALAGVPLAAGLAVADAVLASAGVACGLKWPNDVVVDHRKLAGVLAELEPGGVVLGIGVNLTVPRFPAGVAGVSLHELAAQMPAPAQLLSALLRALGHRLGALEAEGVVGIRQDWIASATGLGAPVRARIAGGTISGTARSIDNSGALLVETATGTVRLVAGEVHLGL